MTPDPALWPALAVAGLGALLDLKDRRLPNWLCAALAVAAAAGLAYSAGPEILGWAFVHALLALAVGMVLFRFGAIGGGDAKFYSAAACAVPLSQALPLLGWTSVVGLGLIIVMLVMRAAKRGGKDALKLRGWSVPYGVAIFGGFALVNSVPVG
jgi:prepilin peptidase CpaA